MSLRKATAKKPLPKPDAMLRRIMAFNEARGGGVLIDQGALNHVGGGLAAVVGTDRYRAMGPAREESRGAVRRATGG